jgi:hypothetical protein
MKLAWVLGSVVAVALTGAAHGAAPACSAQSPRHTVALVELYTSEGCDSCPPADRWLSSLRGRGFTPAQLVPLALHVDYWDYIGWKDPYAKPEFSERQRRLAQMSRPPIAYTPQVVLQGQDFRRWGGEEFAETVARINAKDARATIALTLRSITPEAVSVDLAAELLDATQRASAVVYVAAYESRLASDVKAGENRGKRLEHDFVVRQWLGPLAFEGSARIAQTRSLPLAPSADPKRSGVVAFVQNRGNGEILQALALPACGG